MENKINQKFICLDTSFINLLLDNEDEKNNFLKAVKEDNCKVIIPYHALSELAECSGVYLKFKELYKDYKNEIKITGNIKEMLKEEVNRNLNKPDFVNYDLQNITQKTLEEHRKHSLSRKEYFKKTQKDLKKEYKKEYSIDHSKIKPTEFMMYMLNSYLKKGQFLLEPVINFYELDLTTDEVIKSKNRYKLINTYQYLLYLLNFALVDTGSVSRGEMVDVEIGSFSVLCHYFFTKDKNLASKLEIVQEILLENGIELKMKKIRLYD